MQHAVLVPWTEHAIDGITDVGVIGRPSIDLLHLAVSMSQLCELTVQHFTYDLGAAVLDADTRCNLEAVDEAGDTILLIAARTAPHSIIEQLLLCCASVLATNPNTDEGVLENAARNPSDSVSIAKLLERYGARRLCLTSSVAMSLTHFDSIAVACEAALSVPLWQHRVERFVERERLLTRFLEPMPTFISLDPGATLSIDENLQRLQCQAIPTARQTHTKEAVAQSFYVVPREHPPLASSVQEAGLLQFRDHQSLIANAIQQPEAAAFFAITRTERVAVVATLSQFAAETLVVPQQQLCRAQSFNAESG
jgi:hypothetical protein